MNLKTLVKRIIWPHRYSSEAYLNCLREKGAEIGNGTYLFDPQNTMIDEQRPHMLTIGENVKITSGVTILCHDFSRATVYDYTGMYVGEAGKTDIGANSFIGMNATILMGAKIGDNCIVGAGAVVSGSFPPGVVIAGNPAKTICSVEEFAKKRKRRELEAAVDYACCWRRRYGDWPSAMEMTNAFAWLYLPRTQQTVNDYTSLFELTGIDKERLISDFMTSEPTFGSFDEFIDYCEGQIDEGESENRAH